MVYCQVVHQQLAFGPFKASLLNNVASSFKKLFPYFLPLHTFNYMVQTYFADRTASVPMWCSSVFNAFILYIICFFSASKYFCQAQKHPKFFLWKFLFGEKLENVDDGQQLGYPSFSSLAAAQIFFACTIASTSSTNSVHEKECPQQIFGMKYFCQEM